MPFENSYMQEGRTPLMRNMPASRLTDDEMSLWQCLRNVMCALIALSRPLHLVALALGRPSWS